MPFPTQSNIAGKITKMTLIDVIKQGLIGKTITDVPYPFNLSSQTMSGEIVGVRLIINARRYGDDPDLIAIEVKTEEGIFETDIDLSQKLEITKSIDK